MKNVVILTASPASGKTRWCKRFLNEHPDAIHLNSDNVRIELTGSYKDFSKQDEVWMTFEQRIREYNELPGDFTLIIDALNDLNPIRQKYASLCSNFDHKKLVVIKKPLEETIENNAKRAPEVRVPENILIALYNKFEMPDEKTKALFDEVEIIDHQF